MRRGARQRLVGGAVLALFALVPAVEAWRPSASCTPTYCPCGPRSTMAGAAKCCTGGLGLSRCPQRKEVSQPAGVERFLATPRVGLPIPDAARFVAESGPQVPLTGFLQPPLQPPRGAAHC